MTRADNFRTRQQQLYKNPFIGGGVALQSFFTFSSNCTFSGFLAVSSQRLKLQTSDFAQTRIATKFVHNIGVVSSPTPINWRRQNSIFEHHHQLEAHNFEAAQDIDKEYQMFHLG